MTLEQWNALVPGCIIGTSRKRLYVGLVLGYSPRTEANVLQLHWMSGSHVATASYDTADYRIYEVVQLQEPAPKKQLPVGRRLVFAFRLALAAYRVAFKSAIEAFKIGWHGE